MKIKVDIIIDGYSRTLTNRGLIQFMNRNENLLLDVVKAVEKIKEVEKKPKRGRPRKS